MGASGRDDGKKPRFLFPFSYQQPEWLVENFTAIVTESLCLSRHPRIHLDPPSLSCHTGVLWSVTPPPLSIASVHTARNVNPQRTGPPCLSFTQFYSQDLKWYLIHSRRPANAAEGCLSGSVHGKEGETVQPQLPSVRRTEWIRCHGKPLPCNQGGFREEQTARIWPACKEQKDAAQQTARAGVWGRESCQRHGRQAQGSGERGAGEDGPARGETERGRSSRCWGTDRPTTGMCPVPFEVYCRVLPRPQNSQFKFWNLLSVLFSWWLCVGGREADRERGRREWIATQAWVYVRTERKKLLQDAEYIRRQEIRTQPTANALLGHLGLLGAFFGLQMDMTWESLAPNLHQISTG